jgi:general secretion pathway protein D
VTVNNVTTGITLRFLPKVSPDLMTIESSLSINVSTPTGTTTQGVPQYSSREANTSVRVRNGEAIVIGGLIEKRETSATKGIPGVMDIPILGELFKTTTTDSRFTDLVIVITPQLVGQGQTPATPLVGPPNPGGGVPVAGGTPANPSSPTGSSQPSRPTNLSGSTGTPPAPPMQNPSGTPEEQQP